MHLKVFSAKLLWVFDRRFDFRLPTDTFSPASYWLRDFVKSFLPEDVHVWRWNLLEKYFDLILTTLEGMMMTYLKAYRHCHKPINFKTLFKFTDG